MISTLFFLHSFANNLEMERILINLFLLLYLFEGDVPTFIKAEKSWPNVCAIELTLQENMTTFDVYLSKFNPSISVIFITTEWKGLDA
jgi:hypothetical protein